MANCPNVANADRSCFRCADRPPSIATRFDSSNHVLGKHPSGQPSDEADDGAQEGTGDAVPPLPLLPSTTMSRCAAGGARGGAEFGAGLARVGGLEDFASAAGAEVVGRGFARRATGTVGQGFRAVHFVEIGLVDARCGRAVVVAFTPTPTAFGGRPSPQGGGRRRTRARGVVAAALR